jgi:hypothetical protein
MQDPASAAMVVGWLVTAAMMAWAGVSLIAIWFSTQCFGVSRNCDGPAFVRRPLLFAIGVGGMFSLGLCQHQEKFADKEARLEYDGCRMPDAGCRKG